MEPAAERKMKHPVRLIKQKSRNNELGNANKGTEKDGEIVSSKRRNHSTNDDDGFKRSASVVS